MAVAVTALPTTQRAIVAVDAIGTLRVVDDAPVNWVGSDEVLVKTAAVALNPVDTKMLVGFAVQGAILGFDFAGTVIAIGANVQKVQVGDRILGTGNSMDRGRPAAGAFAQYVSTPHASAPHFHRPEETQTGADQRPTPTKRPYVLISGGSTPTGTMALQLLKLSNIPAIATCSPKHNELVLSYGAEKVFDYRAATWFKLVYEVE